MIRIQLRDGGRVSDQTGYGQFNRSLYLTLKEMGIKVGHDREPLPEANVHLFISPPYSFTDLRPEKLNIGLTMTERESLDGYKDRFDWAGMCNAMRFIITPSEWNKQVFINNGVTVPIEVMPMGVRTNFWQPGRPFRFFSSIDGMGKHGSRWNWEELYKAYVKSFKQGENVEWLIVARSEVKGEFEQENPRICIIKQLQNEQEMLDLYRQSDCYLSYSREGWGCPQWEALSCGLSVIVPNYGVQAETMKDIHKVYFFNGGHLSEDNLKFVDGDIDELKNVMQKVYLRERGGVEQAKKYDWQKIADQLLLIIKKYL